MEGNRRDFAILKEELRFGQGLLIFLTGAALIPLGLMIVIGEVTQSPWRLGILALVLGFIIGAPLALIGMRKIASVGKAWSQVEAAIHEEWRTGATILPGELSSEFPGLESFRKPPTFRPEDLPVLRLAMRFRRGRWAEILSLAMFLGFVAPFWLFAFYLDWRGPVPVSVTATTTFLPLAIMFFLYAKARRGIELLPRLRDYERVTGRQVLPADLREEATESVGFSRAS